MSETTRAGMPVCTEPREYNPAGSNASEKATHQSLILHNL
jgi:hypothetical protein